MKNIEIKLASVKSLSWNSTKPMLKNIAQKIKKMIPKWIPKSDFIFGVLLLVAPLVTQTTFVIKNGSPALPKCAQGSKNEAKMTPKRSPSMKENKKMQFLKVLEMFLPKACQISPICIRALTSNNVLKCRFLEIKDT